MFFHHFREVATHTEFGDITVIEAYIDGSVIIRFHDKVLNLLVIRTETQSTESLAQLRKQIDECDDNIIQELSKRMRVAREIGTYKKEHGITVLQAGRYNEILEKRGAQGEQCGMDSEFMKKIFEAIHEESVRQQMEIINK